MTGTDIQTPIKPAPEAAFWDRIAKSYSRKPIADPQAYETKLAMTRAYLDRSMDVLEIGCGTGGTALLHAPHVESILATDVSPAMIAIAREKLAESGVDNVRFEVASADGVERPVNSLDAVLCLSVLHLLSSRRETLAKLAEMVRPGGVLVASTPCLGDAMGWFRYVAPLGSFLGLIPEFAIFSKDDLRAEVIEAGFEIEKEFEPDDGRTLFLIARRVAH